MQEREQERVGHLSDRRFQDVPADLRGQVLVEVPEAVRPRAKQVTLHDMPRHSGRVFGDGGPIVLKW